MSAVSIQPVITPGDRLSMTLCLAILVHAIIVLGITFTSEDKMIPNYDTMEIILVQQKQPEPTDDAAMLAQANLQGGGDTPEEVIPATPLPPPFPDTNAEVATAATESPPVEAVPETETKPEVKAKNEEKIPEPQMATETDDAMETAPAQQKQKAKAQRKPKPSATELLRNSFKIASLSAQIKRKLEAKAKRPRRKFISASTKAFKYAAYMEAWRAKVERVGNLNYPDEARRRKLSGSLILDVALNANGSINQITIRRSSGHKVLDDAAIQIVKLASPFAPFPDNINQETDILHITRTWQFINNAGFR